MRKLLSAVCLLAATVASGQKTLVELTAPFERWRCSAVALEARSMVFHADAASFLGRK